MSETIGMWWMSLVNGYEWFCWIFIYGYVSLVNEWAANLLVSWFTFWGHGRGLGSSRPCLFSIRWVKFSNIYDFYSILEYINQNILHITKNPPHGVDKMSRIYEYILIFLYSYIRWIKGTQTLFIYKYPNVFSDPILLIIILYIVVAFLFPTWNSVF